MMPIIYWVTNMLLLFCSIVLKSETEDVLGCVSSFVCVRACVCVCVCVCLYVSIWLCSLFTVEQHACMTFPPAGLFWDDLTVLLNMTMKTNKCPAIAVYSTVRVHSHVDQGDCPRMDNIINLCHKHIPCGCGSSSLHIFTPYSTPWFYLWEDD